MQKVNLNLIPGGVRPVINVSQYDEGRQFQLAIYNGSASYDLTGKTVVIEVGKRDGNGCAYDSTDLVNNIPVVAVTGNIVTITTPKQMTAVSGDNSAELKISDSSAEIGTLNFVLECEPSALSPDTPISDTQIPALEDLASQNAQKAEAAVAHYPYIDDTTKNWFVWDAETGAFVDTGVRAQGIDGEGSVKSVNNVSPDADGDVSLGLSDITTVPITTANGGTGNSNGYIRTGQKSGTSTSSTATIEGVDNEAHGTCSHAEGYTTNASGSYTHAEGVGTLAQVVCQHVQGYYNNNKNDTMFEIGNGYDANTRHNLMEVHDDGRIVMKESDALVSGSNLAPVVELTRTMSAQRTAGSYVFVVADKKTYYIDSTIAASGTLTPGTNATEVTTFGEIATLNSDIATKLDIYSTLSDGTTSPINSSAPSDYRIGFTWMACGSNSQGFPENYSFGITMKYSSARHAQLWFGRTGKMYYRYSDGNEWTAWLTIQ